MLHKQPIGIFDSGIGGLTVAKAMSRLLPNEDFIYFGDTTNMPYGEKPSEHISHYTKQITSFLLERGCKMVVIACNTASSAGYTNAAELFTQKELLIDIIQPISEHIATTYETGRVGVIATTRTVSDQAYSQRIKTFTQKLTVSELATPLLASMIEEGFYENNINSRLVNDYLENEALHQINALVLGCTHYPLIRTEIASFYNNNSLAVDIIDGSEIVAKKVKRVLQQNNLENTEGKRGDYKFYISDFTPSFQQTAQYFFDKGINLEHYPMW